VKAKYGCPSPEIQLGKVVEEFQKEMPFDGAEFIGGTIRAFRWGDLFQVWVDGHVEPFEVNPRYAGNPVVDRHVQPLWEMFKSLGLR